jgi:hypothetical protein
MERSRGKLCGRNLLSGTAFAGVTQLVEYLPSKQTVAGSSPVPRSTKTTWGS